MKYGIVVSSDAHIHTGVTVRIKDGEGYNSSDFYILEDGQHCHAMPKRCIDLIDEYLFDFFEPRTKMIKEWIEEMDKEPED